MRAGFLLLLVACGGEAPPAQQGLCEMASDCAVQGGSPDGEVWSEAELQDCIDTYDAAEASYVEAGCGDAYTAFMDCALAHATCNPEDGELQGIYGPCDPELQAVSACLGATTSGQR